MPHSFFNESKINLTKESILAQATLLFEAEAELENLSSSKKRDYLNDKLAKVRAKLKDMDASEYSSYYQYLQSKLENAEKKHELYKEESIGSEERVMPRKDELFLMKLF